MTASLSGVWNAQEFTDLGVLGVGMRLHTYTYGTTTHKVAFTDSAGNNPHTYTSDGSGGQYIALNARGELPAPLFLAAGPYDLCLKTAAGATVWTRKAVPGDDSVDAVETALAASSGSTLLGFIQAGTGAVARTAQSKMRERVSVADFGAVGDGVTDDTAEIQAAVDYAISISGATVYFPPGSYVISDSIDVIGSNVTLQGSGAATSNLVLTVAGQDGIVFGDGSNMKHRNYVADMGFAASVTKTSGVAVRFRKVTQGGITRFFSSQQFCAVSMEDSVLTYVSDGYIINPTAATGKGVLVAGGNDTSLRDLVVVGDSANQPLCGYHITKTAALWMDNAGTLESGIGLLLQPAGTDVVEHLFTSRCAFDSCSSHGVLVQPEASATVRRWASVGDWCATNDLHGICTTGSGTIKGLRFTNLRAIGNGQHGVFLDAGLDVQISGGIFGGNSTSVSGTFSGISIDTAGEFQITGARCGPADGLSATQEYGIEITNAAAAQFLVAHNDLRGNSTGPLADGSSGAGKIVADNLGFGYGSATYDPGNLVDGAGATTTVTVTGAVLGDVAEASFALDLQGVTLTAWVSAADTVSVRFQNESGVAHDLGEGALRAFISRRT